MSGWLAASVLVVACATPVSAQYFGRVNDQNPQNGTHLRATAVLEYTGDLKDMKQSRLVPIAIWDGMQYQPGGLYLAQPAPLAVLSGTQYELQDAGKPEGFFNIRDAEDLAGQWVGVGNYEAPPPPKAKAPASRSNHVYAVKDVDPDKPHFAHRPADEQPGQGASGNAPAPAAQSRARRRSGSPHAAFARRGQRIRDQALLPDRARETPIPIGRPSIVARVLPMRRPTAQPPVDPNRPLLEYKPPPNRKSSIRRRRSSARRKT